MTFERRTVETKIIVNDFRITDGINVTSCYITIQFLNQQERKFFIFFFNSK